MASEYPRHKPRRVPRRQHHHEARDDEEDVDSGGSQNGRNGALDMGVGVVADVMEDDHEGRNAAEGLYVVDHNVAPSHMAPPFPRKPRRERSADP